MRATDCVVAGHRGFRAKHAENTIEGFTQCFKAGATMFETDVWTTKDRVLIISHDVSTKRVFVDADGNATDFNILETNFDQLKDLRAIPNRERLMTFKDLLEWFKKYVDENPGEHRIMLDIKRLNPPNIVKMIFDDLLAVHNDLLWWFTRVQLGFWDLKFLQFLNQDEYFQKAIDGVKPNEGMAHFDILHISALWADSMRFIAYNEYLDLVEDKRFKYKLTTVLLIYISMWLHQFLTEFLPVVKAKDLKLFAWTVNTYGQLKYFVTVCRTAKLREFGVISDDPGKMLELLKTDKGHKDVPLNGSIVPWKYYFSHGVYKWVVGLFHFRGGPSIERQFHETVDGSEVTHPTNSWGLIAFAFLQKYGIF